ncbi:hypothetical protein GPA27_01820 [Aromatoleum toluolicum]|uniref:Uncharacterized protein n=1 Tax=Aromatoleum toluolicum TaxID=90060 RepID=A0ABX1NA23_9RHOO|nr:hypothetical protein [Aromatoleum toluolicum]NMF96135.1 hypothetical protein [Aromatoleum toluolicum]
MDPESWLDLLAMLAVRFAHTGIVDDLRTLDREELWGLYLHLSRAEVGENDD